MAKRAHRNARWTQKPKRDHDESLYTALRVHPDRPWLTRQFHVSGACPSCYGPIDFISPVRVAIGGSPGLRGQGAKERSLTVQCNCELDHPGRPAGETGCGQSFVLVIGGDE